MANIASISATPRTLIPSVHVDRERDRQAHGISIRRSPQHRRLDCAASLLPSALGSRKQPTSGASIRPSCSRVPHLRGELPQHDEVDVGVRFASIDAQALPLLAPAASRAFPMRGASPREAGESRRGWINGRRPSAVALPAADSSGDGAARSAWPNYFRRGRDRCAATAGEVPRRRSRRARSALGSIADRAIEVGAAGRTLETLALVAVRAEAPVRRTRPAGGGFPCFLPRSGGGCIGGFLPSITRRRSPEPAGGT